MALIVSGRHKAVHMTMPIKHEAKLTEGHIGRQLVKLTAPMIAGIFAMVAFHATDTYFVAKLGTPELAAMSFTFPVVMIMRGIVHGLGVGAASVISRAIGEGDHHKVQRLATDSLILTVPIVGLFSMTGLLTMNPLFRALGASDHVLSLVRRYMTVWYSCVAVLVIPMVGNNAIRATGDTLTPSVIMIFAAALNVVLDPIMIFGLWGFPRLELVGAAFATVASRFLSLVAALSILHYRCRLIAWGLPSLRSVWDSWKRILHIAIPTAATLLLMPFSRGVIIRLAACFGQPAVAAIGAGSRLEDFAMIVPMALGSILIPFIGQNWGAQEFGRVRRARIYSNWFGVVWGFVCVLCFLPSASLLAKLFSKDVLVARAIVHYLWIVPVGHGLMHICAYSSFALNAIGKPLSSAMLNATRVFLFVIPCAFIGAHLLSIPGLFCGIAVGHLLSGVVALCWTNRVFRTGFITYSTSS